MKLADNPCTKSLRRVSIEVETENRATYKLINPGRKWLIGKTRVEDCLINEGKRCDWIFWIDDSIQAAYFIELKGSDIADGVEQLLHSIKILKSEVKGYRVFARLSFSKSNQKQLRYSQEKELMNLTKQLNGDYVKRSSPFEESLPL